MLACKHTNHDSNKMRTSNTFVKRSQVISKLDFWFYSTIPSPLNKATKNGAPRQAGTRYSSAG